MVRLVRQFQQRNPALREAAIRRLAPYPDVAGPDVVKAFREGSLAARLAALEVLEQWKAPLDGFDPWQPETFTAERLARLERWLEDKAVGDDRRRQSADAGATGLGPAADRADAQGRRRGGGRRHPPAPGGAGRVAAAGGLRTAEGRRHGPGPPAAAGPCAIGWRPPTRWRCVGRAESSGWPTPSRGSAGRPPRSWPSWPAATISRCCWSCSPTPIRWSREISLRGLQHIGGKQANAALVKLLGDPEPNVRAAVLKQLEESPNAAMTPAVVKYLEGEKDPDLVVHGIRFLQAGQGHRGRPVPDGAVEAPELAGPRRGRRRHRQAERIEAAYLRRSDGRRGNNVDADTQLQVDAYVALLDLLDDAEPSSWPRRSRASPTPTWPWPSSRWPGPPRNTPNWPATSCTILARATNMRAKAIPYLRKFCQHRTPRVRAAAIAALVRPPATTSKTELAAALATRKATSAWPRRPRAVRPVGQPRARQDVSKQRRSH